MNLLILFDMQVFFCIMSSMSYKEKPLLKVYKYTDSFHLLAIIDDYMSCSFQRTKYEAGQFSIEINYNIPNAKIFDKNLFIQFGNDKKDFGVITSVIDSIGSDGKGSQIRSISGFDCRYLLKRRIISTLNANGIFSFTGKGEECIRKLVRTQCGIEAEEKRRLPIINNDSVLPVGNIFTVQEAYTNLYDVCVTIATQTEIMWFMEFENNELSLKFAKGNNLSNLVRFDVDYESLSSGTFTDSTESYSNVVYIGGQGTNDSRDIYEGEQNLTEGYLKINKKDYLLINGTSKLYLGRSYPKGVERFESWDDQSSMTSLAEYKNEAESVLSQYAQTTDIQGQGLPKSPYMYKEDYDVGDFITVAFSGKSAKVQILSVTEHWTFGQYDFQFTFGKPINDLSKQLSIILNQIQFMQSTTDSNTTDSIRWYTLPTDTEQPKDDIKYDTIGFIGNCDNDTTFRLYSDGKTGAKTYHIYLKQVEGTGKLILTTEKQGAENLELDTGTYVTIIYIDENGNVIRTI